jgi:tyrosyl-DNA phosphodiesterase 1
MANEPPTKRQRLDPRKPTDEPQSPGVDAGRDRAISPPLPRRQRPLVAPSIAASSWEIDNIQEGLPLVSKHVTQNLDMSKTDEHIKLVPSPIQLTRVEDLAPHQNLDAVGLRDILGDPMIKECWNFNFLFNVDFVM